MRQVAKFACLLMVWGIVAVAAHADSTTTTTSTTADPTIILNDPSCPDGAYCVDLTFVGNGDVQAGTQQTFDSSNPLEFTTPYPFPNGLSYTCSSDTFANCNTIVTAAPPIDLNGVYFWNGTLTVGNTYTIGSQGGPLLLDLPSDFTCTVGCSNGVIDLTPEPGTIILFAIGFLFLLGFTARGFRSSARA